VQSKTAAQAAVVPAFAKYAKDGAPTELLCQVGSKAGPAALTDNVLFGDVWERRELSKRDRSLVTVAALVALNRPDQLRRGYLFRGKSHEWKAHSMS